VIQIEGLRKSFQTSDRLAVDDLSLDIPAGTFFTVLGPSGCGKSTTLRPEAGEITINGTTIFSTRQRINLPPQRRPIGMVFQSSAAWPHMSVRDNVAYPLKTLRKTRREVDDAVSGALHLVELEHLAERPAPLLSGGEQQRMALARALVGRPEVLLLDEPLSNLDARFRESMRSDLRALQRKLAFTAIYVTHDQDDAFALSDTMAVMNAGRIVELGSPEPIYRMPATQFGAKFLGAATELAGTVLGVEATGTIRVDTAIGTLRCTSRERPANGAAVLVYIRPEGVRLVEGPADIGAVVIQGRVDDAAFMGSVLDWTIMVGGVSVKARSLASMRASRKIHDSLHKDLFVEIAMACCVPASDTPTQSRSESFNQQISDPPTAPPISSARAGHMH
jgi:iron(III) transport system ATP-binding protein